jgi:hypothetical protein
MSAISGKVCIVDFRRSIDNPHQKFTGCERRQQALAALVNRFRRLVRMEVHPANPGPVSPFVLRKSPISRALCGKWGFFMAYVGVKEPAVTWQAETQSLHRGWRV